jgi:predicted nucleic acid-binding protein
MAVDRTTPLFFDATCLYAAAHSPAGGSARLFRLCRLGWLQGWVAQPVLLEAERALQRKATAAALARYEQLLRLTPLQYTRLPADPIARYPEINAKDAHVYAAARACRARYLITLDKHLVDEINALSSDPRALSPGGFLQQVLPTHPDYAAEPAGGQRSDHEAPHS